MCLDTITNCNPKKKSGTGYKVFVICGSSLQFCYRRYEFGMAVPQKRWLVAEGGIVNTPTGRYLAGFHIFSTLADAKKYRKNVFIKAVYKIVKVKYRKAVAEGKELWGLDRLNVVVAQEMYVPKVKL